MRFDRTDLLYRLRHTSFFSIFFGGRPGDVRRAFGESSEGVRGKFGGALPEGSGSVRGKFRGRSETNKKQKHRNTHFENILF